MTSREGRAAPTCDLGPSADLGRLGCYILSGGFLSVTNGHLSSRSFVSCT